jgi:hypothetical protein
MVSLTLPSTNFLNNWIIFSSSNVVSTSQEPIESCPNNHCNSQKMSLCHLINLPFFQQPKRIYGTCNLLSVEMSSVDEQKKYANRGKNMISSILIASLINLTHLPQMFSQMVYFIPDAISYFQQNSVSHTLSLSVSPLSCSFPRISCLI